MCDWLQLVTTTDSHINNRNVHCRTTHQYQARINTDRQAPYSGKLSVSYGRVESNYAGKSYTGGARVEQLDLGREIALWES
jgi:hypothetical protein